MDDEVMRQVIKEILEEQKSNSRLLMAIKEDLNELEEKVEKAGTMDSVEQIKEIHQDLVLRIEDAKRELLSLRGGSRIEKRFLFFPEQNAKEYYSVILKWLLYALIATYLYKLLSELIERFNS